MITVKQCLDKCKKIPAGWAAAIAVLAVAAFRWIKKISGLELLGLPAEYDQIKPMAIGIGIFSVLNML